MVTYTDVSMGEIFERLDGLFIKSQTMVTLVFLVFLLLCTDKELNDRVWSSSVGRRPITVDLQTG